MKYRLIFSEKKKKRKKNEKVFINVVGCSRDCHFKGSAGVN